MIEAVHYLLLLLWGIIVPYVIGMLLTKFFKKEALQKSFSLAIILGTVTLWAVFQVLAVPFIYKKQSFNTLANFWQVIIACLFFISMFINRKRFINVFCDKLKEWKTQEKKTYFILIGTVFIILFQTYMLAGNMHTDTDDARYVVSAMEAVENNTMLLEHPLTGQLLDRPIGELKRDAIAPFSIYMALFSNLLNLHPTVVHHVMWPIVMIPFAYLIYWLLAKRLLHGDKQGSALFLFLAAFCHCFAYDSVYMPSYYLLIRIWQGKAVLATIILPIVWYLLLEIADNPSSKEFYIALTLTMTAACLTSSMAYIQPIMLAGAYAIVLGIWKKSFRLFAGICICMIPNVIYAASYYILY